MLEKSGPIRHWKSYGRKDDLKIFICYFAILALSSSIVEFVDSHQLIFIRKSSEFFGSFSYILTDLISTLYRLHLKGPHYLSGRKDGLTINNMEIEIGEWKPYLGWVLFPIEDVGKGLTPFLLSFLFPALSQINRSAVWYLALGGNQSTRSKTDQQTVRCYRLFNSGTLKGSETSA